MGGEGHLLKGPARYVVIGGDHLGCNQRDEGAQFVGCGRRYQQRLLQEMELFLSHRGIKTRIVSDTLTQYQFTTLFTPDFSN